MSRNGQNGGGNGGENPETALEEVMREIEQAETRGFEAERERRHRGGTGDATSPNTEAQEQSLRD